MFHGFGFGGCCGFGGMGGFGWVGLLLNLVLTAGVLIGLIVLVVWAVRRMSHGQGISASSSVFIGASAREILQARYAKGEVTREEYKRMLEDIGSSH